MTIENKGTKELQKNITIRNKGAKHSSRIWPLKTKGQKNSKRILPLETKGQSTPAEYDHWKQRGKSSRQNMTIGNKGKRNCTNTPGLNNWCYVDTVLGTNTSMSRTKVRYLKKLSLCLESCHCGVSGKSAVWSSRLYFGIACEAIHDLISCSFVWIHQESKHTSNRTPWASYQKWFFHIHTN